MLTGKKDCRGNIVSDGSIRNWFCVQQQNQSISPNKKENPQAPRKITLRNTKNTYRNNEFGQSNNTDFTKKRSTIYKGDLKINFEDYNSGDKENENPVHDNSKKLTKKDVKDYAKGYYSYTNNNNYYYNKGKNFWSEKRKFRNEVEQCSKYDVKVLKKKFDTIIKSNQKLKDTSSDLIEEDCEPAVKFNGQTELKLIPIESKQDEHIKHCDSPQIIEIEECSADPQILEYFEVEKVLGRRIKRNPEEGLYYLIKWKSLELKDATWEHISKLGNVKDKLIEFEKLQENYDNPKINETLQKKRDIKTLHKIDDSDEKTFGKFELGDKARKISKIFEDKQTKQLKATIDWKRKKGEKNLKSTDYLLDDIKLYDPEVLLDYYESNFTLNEE